MNKVRSIAVAAVLAMGALGIGASHAQNAGRPEAADDKPLPIKADHRGRAIFEQQCAACHAAGPGDDGARMLPGTATLAMRYDGRLPGALELRTDLGVEAVSYFVRNGAGAMPPFRKAELSDADIAAIAGYLKATAEANGRR